MQKILAASVLMGMALTAANAGAQPAASGDRSADANAIRAHIELGDEERTALLAARDAVWRAWFAGDTTALAALVPPELVTIESSANMFGTHDSTLAGSRGFAASGAKLTRLVFPRTEFQAYGNTAILYTTYEMDIRSDAGPARTVRGAATEVFVQQNGRWLNTGWQLAPDGK